MKRLIVLAVLFAGMLLGPARAFAQTPQPCATYEPNSIEYYDCMGIVSNEAPSSQTLAQQQQMMTLAIVGAVVVMVVLVGGSMMLSRRRLRNVPANEIKELLRAAVPPEAGAVSDDMLDSAVRQLTGVSASAQMPVVVVLIGFGAFVASYLATGFGPITTAIVVVFILAVLVLAIRAVLMLSRARGSTTTYLEVLGFSLTDVPSLGFAPTFGGFGMRSYGGTTMGGLRHGRNVTVTFEATGMSTQRVVTRVAQPSSQTFEVKGKDRDWQSKGLPQPVVDALSRLGTLDRQIVIRGGPNGVEIQRDRNTMEATSARGTVNWIKDIQLAEKLADGLK